MESKEQKLIEMKKKLLRALGSDKQIVSELAEIKNILHDKELPQKVEHLIIEKVEPLIPSEINISNFPDPVDQKSIEVSNFPKQEIIKEIAVNNFPKQPETIKVSNIKDIVIPNISNPIKTLYKSIEGLLEPFIKKFDGLITGALQYIKEPDKTTISKDMIVDYYGSRKVEYKLIRKQGKIREVIRNER